MKIAVIVLEVIACIALIVTILLQSGKEAGLSGAIAGNSESYMNKPGKSMDKVLASATKWIAAIWLILTLALSLM